MFFVWLTAASTRRRKLILAVGASAYSRTSFHKIFCSIIGSPPSLHQFLKVFLHESQLLFQFFSFLLGLWPFLQLAVSFFLKRLHRPNYTARPFLGGDSISSPFQARKALEAASCTWMMRFLDAWRSASCTFKSMSLSFSAEDKRTPNL